MTANLRERLRTETANLHQRVEALPAMQRLLAPDYTRLEYRALLETLWQLHRTWESVLFDDAGRALIDHGIVLKANAPRLALDLALLGYDPSDRQPAPPPGAAAEDAARLGIHYVLVGAGFGSVPIHRHLRHSLGDDLAARLQFHGARPDRAAWRLLTSLLASPDITAHGAQAITAARLTFEAFYRELSALPPPAAR